MFDIINLLKLSVQCSEAHNLKGKRHTILATIFGYDFCPLSKIVCQLLLFENREYYLEYDFDTIFLATAQIRSTLHDNHR